MIYQSRRAFLKTSMMSLSIPFLESLSQKVYAAASIAQNKRLLFFCLSNAWYQDQIFPSSTNYLIGPEGVRYIPLSSISGDISPLFPANKFGQIKSKMNIMRGFDLTEVGGGGHSQLYSLGASNEKGTDPVKNTIDTVIANSSEFYTTTPFRKSLNAVPVNDGSYFGYNYSFQNGEQRSILAGPSSIFTDFFSSQTFPPNGNGASQTTVVDSNVSRRLALNSTLNKLSNLISSPKLSADDKRKLSDHADMINKLLPTIAPSVGSNIGSSNASNCVRLSAISGINESMKSSTGNQDRLRACLDQIYMAFNCQLTNVAYIHPVVAYDTGNWDMGDSGNDAYHQMAGHKHDVPNYLKYKGWVFDQLLYLLSLMDSTKESNGLSMLDNSLVVVISNDACSIHSYQDIPVITFGSLGGTIKTGHYINYQRPAAKQETGTLEIPNGSDTIGYYYTYKYNLGRPLNSLYTTVLNALKITNNGFGNYVDSGNQYSEFTTASAKKLSLPILT